MPRRAHLLRFVLGLALAPVGLVAQEHAATALLSVPEGSAIVINAVVTLPLGALPAAVGVPVHKGSILAEMDVRKLERELSELQRELRSIQAEKRFRTSSKEVQRGGGPTNVQRPNNGVEENLAIKEANALRDMLEVQTRLSQASPRAPENGYLVRAFYGVGADAKRRKPLVSFVAATKTSLALQVALEAAAGFPPGTEVTVSSQENRSLQFRGVVTRTLSGIAGAEVTVRPLELPFLALDRPTSVTIRND
ncbi:MAG: hypothetical protein ABIU84_14540 [Thermoanaerobaculia bacterium]